MARWHQTLRDRLFVLLLAVLATSIVALGVTALWPLAVVAVHWGPVFWASVAALGLAVIVFYAWHRKVQEANALATVDPYSFAEAVARVRARDRASAPAPQSAARRSLAVPRRSEVPSGPAESLDGSVSTFRGVDLIA